MLNRLKQNPAEYLPIRAFMYSFQPTHNSPALGGIFT